MYNSVSFSPADVFASHERASVERQVTSVVPEATGIALDSEVLSSAAEVIGMGDFNEMGMRGARSSNLVDGISFTCVGSVIAVNGVSEEFSEDQLHAVADIAGQVKRVDEFFRFWHGNLPVQMPTNPRVAVIAGQYTGTTGFDAHKHFDYDGRIPLVALKQHFMGDPNFPSNYYPGDYKYRFPWLSSKVIDITGRTMNANPKPRGVFQHEHKVARVPSRQLSIEPWNALHGGPRHSSAQNTQRGIISVIYNLLDLQTDIDNFNSCWPEAA